MSKQNKQTAKRKVAKKFTEERKQRRAEEKRRKELEAESQKYLRSAEG